MLLASILLLSTTTFSQGLTCGAAVALPVNSTCVNQAFTNNENGTGAEYIASCAFSGTSYEDVWYSIVGTGSLITVTISGTDQDYALTALSTCGGGQLDCTQQTSGTTGSISFANTLGTTYFIHIQRRSGNNNANMSGNICAITAPPATGCPSDLIVGTTLFSNTGLTTCGSGDDFTNSDACGSNYMGGDDYVIEYTPTTSECVQFNLSNTGGWVGIFLTDDCPNAVGATCLTNATSTGGNPSIVYTVTAGTTYYITISTFPAPQCTAFDIDILACPPPPANDECTGAIPLTVNPNNLCGSTTSGTVVDATSSAQANGCGGTADDDVWYSFVATSTIHIVSLLNIAGSSIDMYHSVYSGTCGSIGAAIVCSDPNSSTLTGLTIGNTYFVRVYTFTGTSGQTSTFDVCIGTPPPPPVNDECTGAIALTVNPDDLCGSTTTGTIESSSASAQANGCGGTADDDVWYSFVATAAVHTVDLLNVAGSTTDLYHSVYSGTCGSIGAAIVCSDPNSSTLSGLTIGNTYFVRIYTFTGTNGQTSTFDVCIGTPVPVVCVADLTVAATLYSNTGLTTCGAGDDYSNADACGSSYMGGDDFTIAYTPTTSECVQFGLSNTGTWVGIFLTDNCPNVPGANCLTSGTNSAGNPSMNYTVTAGTTYYITVSTFPAPQCTAFDIDIIACPPPPSNDECAGAISLTVNPDNLCGSTTAGTILNATTSAPANGCGGTANDDVWYSFVATGTAHIVSLLNVVGSTTDLYHSVYSGTCGFIGAALVCSDPNLSVISGLTIGNTYFVRVYSWTGTAGQTTTFDICIGTPPPPPPNDNCGGAISVSVNSGSCTAVTSSIYSATTSPDPNGCGGNADDVWFTFTATTTDVQIDLSNVSGSTTDLYHSVYAGTCGALGAELVCSDPNSSQVNSLTVGNIYFVRVYSWTGTAGQTSSFDICISEIGPCGVTSTTEDFCPYAATLTQALGSWSSNTSPTYTADLPGNINSVFCGSIENNSWYEFTALGATEVFNITSVTNCVSGIQAQIYEVTYDAGGCCTGFTSVSNCFNPGNTSTGTITATGLTAGNNYMLMFDGFAGAACDFTMSNWTATGIVLPVELVELEVIGMSRQNIIAWKTVSESNSSHFTVLRSFDGINFSNIGTVDAAGESTNLISYQFADEDVRTGTVYYRLEQYDLDGSMISTEIVSLNRSDDHGGILAARPNPTEDVLFVEVKPNSMHMSPTIQMMDSRGLIVRENALIPGELNIVDMSLSDLASGVYFLMYIDNEGIIHSEKILKK